MTVTIFSPQMSVEINGGSRAGLIRARVESSFSSPTTRAVVTFLEDPGWGQGDDLDVFMGNGTTNGQRFHGSIYQGDYTNSGGGTVELVAYGPMLRVQKFRNPYPKGLSLMQLTGGPATDELIARAVLEVVGVPFNSGNIGGTGITRGALAAIGYTWKPGESALAYLDRLAKASLGYRMIESTDGQIYRTQILGQAGDSEMSFTEGQDIFEGGHTSRSTLERYTAWNVQGFDYGNGLGPVSFSDPTDPGAQEVFTHQSEMIERGSNSDPGGGITCEQVLDYVRSETDHEIVKLSGLSTPRDDIIGPGQTHSVNSGLLGVSQSLWVMGVSIECTQEWFTQTMEYRT